MSFSFQPSHYHSLCDELASRDQDLKKILDEYGYPPLWSRPNHFATLVRIILEQQVSLSSAAAAYHRLRLYTGRITPISILSLTDRELKNCYFSRQKTTYVRHLAAAMLNREISLEQFALSPDDEIRQSLTRIKGIGNWTTDIYLLMALRRMDIFPLGDLALVKAIAEIKQLNSRPSSNHLLRISDSWKPYRSISTRMLWHYYIQKNKIRVPD